MITEETKDQTEIKIEDDSAEDPGTKGPESGAGREDADTKQAGAGRGTDGASEEADPNQSESGSEKSPETGGDQGNEPGDKSDEPGSSSPEEDEELSARYMRLAADFQNYKRRVEKEKTDIYAYANEQLVTQLLDVMDNFERALEAETTDEGFSEGMKLIFQQLTAVLERAGLEEIKAQGEDFDPNYHNAVLTGDDPDYESGKVTQVMQKGYTLKGKVIRPSMVKVNN